MNYGDYLHLDPVLTAQHPQSDAHDELLFIIQHQTSELWMKLALHELRSARTCIAADDLRPAMKMLTRVARIFEQLNSAWQVLRTMTPSEYTTFRDALGPSSGFQSWQYRAIEFMAGNRQNSFIKLHSDRPEAQAMLQDLVTQPSIYDTSIALLARRGLPIDPVLLDRPKDVTHAADPTVLHAWQTVYRDPEIHWDLYELAEKLVDFEDYFRRWRFNHVTTVERVIGFKRGTGGTEGVSYLRRMLDVVLFPELWDVRTTL